MNDIYLPPIKDLINGQLKTTEYLLDSLGIYESYDNYSRIKFCNHSNKKWSCIDKEIKYIYNGIFVLPRLEILYFWKNSYILFFEQSNYKSLYLFDLKYKVDVFIEENGYYSVDGDFITFGK